MKLKMRFIAEQLLSTTALILLSSLVFIGTVGASEKIILTKKDVTTWPKAELRVFGCFLEKEFGHKDKKFNCQLKTYQNDGDPCKNTAAYYEGVAFPPGKSAEVDNRFEDIKLSWEQGELQNVAITLKQKMSEAEIRKSFKLPKEASVQDCSLKNSCIILTGFDHVGAGDVECGE